MISRLFRIFLSISLVFTAPVGLAQSSEEAPPATPEERYTFLTAVMERVEVTLGMNIAYMKGIELCFRGDGGPHCDKDIKRIRSGSKNEYPVYRKHIFNNTLLFHAGRFFKLFEKQAHAFLHGKAFKPANLKELFIDNWINPMSNAENVVESQIPEIRFTQKEIQKLLNDRSMKITHRDKENKVVIEDYAYNLPGYMKRICNDYHLELKEKDRIRVERIGLKSRYSHSNSKTRPFCDQFKIQYVPYEGFVFEEPRFIDKGDALFLFNFTSEFSRVREKALIAQKHLLARFYQGVAKRPYIALLSRANPRDEELAHVFSLLGENAKEELRIVRENAAEALGMDVGNQLRLIRDQKIVDSRRADRARRYRGQTLERLNEQYPILDPVNEGNQKAALAFMGYGPIIKNVVTDPNTAMREDFPETNFGDVAGELAKDYAFMQLKKIGGALVLAVGATVACFFPAGKFVQGFNWARKIITVGKAEISVGALLCFGFTGAAVNIYFYQEAQHIYEQTWRRVFASKEGSVLLAEMNALSEAEFGLVLEMIMLPIGVIGVRQAYRLSKSLTKDSWDYLQSVRQY